MAKIATTIDQQIALLRSRGIVINDENKAREILLDIGYYRLCFYAFPFEKSYPQFQHRNHEYISGVSIEDIVALYYFDYDLRKILLPFLIRIEVKLRTQIVYLLSNKYAANPTWFMDPTVVSSQFISSFDKQVYDAIKKNPIIKRHHKAYIHEKYAPAWKTIEFMTLGNIVTLYDSLLDVADQMAIAKSMNVNTIGVFSSYIETLRVLRNACAHGMVLYDMRLAKAIKNGPAGKMDVADKQSLGGVLIVVRYLLAQVSTNRECELVTQIREAYVRLNTNSPISAQKILEISNISV